MCGLYGVGGGGGDGVAVTKGGDVGFDLGLQTGPGGGVCGIIGTGAGGGGGGGGTPISIMSEYVIMCNYCFLLAYIYYAGILLNVQLYQ